MLARATPPNVWQWAIDNERTLRQVLKWAGVPSQLCDDAFSEVVLLRIGRLFETFDETRGVPLLSYVRLSVYRYAVKWLASQYRRERRKLPLSCDDCIAAVAEASEKRHLEGAVNQSREEEVLELLEGCDGEDLQLLQWRFQDSESFREIGDRLGVDKGTARLWCLAALQRIEESIERRKKL